MIEITQENYSEIVEKATLPVVIEFGAVWCAPCKRLEPELEKLKGIWTDKFVLAHVNVDEAPDLALQFHVMSVPTVVILTDGMEKDRFTGYKPINKIIDAFQKYIDLKG